MAKYTKTYTFLGTGIIWDSTEHKELCSFDKHGRLVTSDSTLVDKLLKLGVPYEDAQSNILSRTEYAVEILKERINILERINEEQRIKIEKLERDNMMETMLTREQLEAELKFIGAPYPRKAKDSTLVYILREYKRQLREKIEREQYTKEHNI